MGDPSRSHGPYMDRNHLMLKALPAGDPAKAEALLIEHLNDAEREILSAHEPEIERPANLSIDQRPSALATELDNHQWHVRASDLTAVHVALPGHLPPSTRSPTDFLTSKRMPTSGKAGRTQRQPQPAGHIRIVQVRAHDPACRTDPVPKRVAVNTQIPGRVLPSTTVAQIGHDRTDEISA